MSRNAPPTSIPRRASQWASHLRHSSKSSSEQSTSFDISRSPDTVSSHSTIRESQPYQQQQQQLRFTSRVCTITINESINRDDILLNLDLFGGAIKPGMLMSISHCKPDHQGQSGGGIFGTTRSISFQRLRDAESGMGGRNAEVDPDRKYIFVAKDMPKQIKASQPNVEVYIAKHVGDAFNMRRGTQVVLAPVDENSPAVEASHVELTFKDMYLSRADMWRLAVNDLAERTVYKGQVLYFMGTIKAVVSTVFVDGRKVHSAFFGKETRPVFRSESARYVLFIQMAREMWDFDADGSGEVLFYKVVNGFLPALFKKWSMMQVKHLVSIVLFARVEYDIGITADLANTNMHDYYTGYQTTGNKRPYKDFYRVVVSEMSSGEWTTILRTLKREHNNFRRDISIHHETFANEAMEIPEIAGGKGTAGSRIRAESSLAMHGNFLEAINLASLVYSQDYIDRDLLRTGISVVVISPGSGVFEVEHEALRRSTEALISNGIGIDLICIGSIPLHSVPLFRYRNPHFNIQQSRTRARSLRSRDSTPRQPTPLSGSYVTLSGSVSPTKVGDSSKQQLSAVFKHRNEEWSFAIPQWLHVSYWTGKTEGALSYQGITLSATGHDIAGSAEEFAVRCRLYDLQMRSVLDTNEIETPQLHNDPGFPDIQGTLDRARRAGAPGISSPHGVFTTKTHETLLEHVYGLHKFNAERMAKGLEAPLWKRLQQYDEGRARLPASRNSTTKPKVYADLEESTRKQLSEDASLFGTSVNGGRKGSDIPTVALSSSVASSHSTRSRLDSSDRSHSETMSRFKSGGRRESNATIQSNYLAPKTPKFIRQISLGHRGFGIAAPKAAIAELKAETVNATPMTDRMVRSPSSTSLTAPMKTINRADSPRRTPAAAELTMAGSMMIDSSDGIAPGTPSRPILIKNSISAMDPIRTIRNGVEVPIARSAKPDDRDIRSSHVLREEDEQKLRYSKLRAGGLPELPAMLSPTTALAPWLVVLNPSNPEANKVDDALLFSRWQHVFPRPSEMSVMKWKSLSSPAAVPLTTEYFPSKEQFDTEYQRQPYTISQNLDDEYGDEGTRSRDDFLRELINARFAHGFQVVVGPSVAKAFGQKTVKATDVLSRDKPVEDGTSIFMSIGNTIHQLSCANGTEVDINIYTRKPTASASQNHEAYRTYKPAIRTLYDPTYLTSEREIWSPQTERNWNFIDSFLAGHTEEMTENLRYWRARFVLIPMPIEKSGHAKDFREPHATDDDEEIRLEGIRKLSQLWLKQRYLPPSERQFQSGGDPNPLDIVYKTEDASMVIAAELESLPIVEGADPSFRKPHLVSSKERFTKTNFNLTTLAEAIQQPIENGGIRMQTRRWHLQRYSHCFIGSEMTTWLLANFEDLENREEAVELGNSLMAHEDDKSKSKDNGKDTKKDRDRGIFVHVDKRHNFRDGQYFYRVASDFSKPSVPGWFNSRKKDSSVPPTPVAENLPHATPHLGFADRPNSVHQNGSPRSDATTPRLQAAGGRRARVMLSKMIKYDVDPRKKSYRPERINLHYDRLHNPDNCYHIRLDWMNVTAKLIEDTIKQWASIATTHGLRLVEVPISEATQISAVNPFRRPVHVKLALPPPTQRPITYYYPNQVAPQPQPGKHYYQRALLRKFDYVLDHEAASAFPSDVSVSYSWGTPDFKHTQYIHRSGMLLAQIVDDGDIYLAANRLYSNRATSQQAYQARGSAEVQAPPPPTNERVARLMQSSSYTNFGTLVSNSSSGPHNNSNSGVMIEGTPISSPMCRPTLFASPGNRGQQYADVATTLGPRPLPTSGIGSDWTAESRINELARFCGDVKSLEQFYKETLEAERAFGYGQSVAATPASFVPATIPEERGGGGGGDGDTHVLDANIPALGLPEGVLSGYGGGSLLGGGFGGGETMSPGSRAGTPGSTASGGALSYHPHGLPHGQPGGEPRSLFLRRASVQHN